MTSQTGQETMERKYCPISQDKGNQKMKSGQ